MFVGVIEDALGVAITRRYLPGRPFDVPINILDNSLIRREMDWSSRVSLCDGIARTAAWLRRESQESDGSHKQNI